ncbi:DUF3895 domain-containing protein [Ferdinandcohnia sp. SAFN-114]|uniref:DUF3895 domain-containing protein n=1 Tax=Ferdinandcohnia sp. SAFN-114 TaxID=3387275 RepID=UPI003F7E0EF7
MYLLKQSKRDEIMQSLNTEQQQFLSQTLKRGKKTVFTNILALSKASSENENIEDIANSWEWVDYIDGGTVTPDLKCECGRSLRYQYIVKNLITNKIVKLGIKHFEDHTGIPGHLVKDIIKGFEKIDYELDEILTKHMNGWSLQTVGLNFIPENLVIPSAIQSQLELDLPLLDLQVDRLRKLIWGELKKTKSQKPSIPIEEIPKLQDNNVSYQENVEVPTSISNRPVNYSMRDNNTSTKLTWNNPFDYKIEENESSKQERLKHSHKVIITSYIKKQDTVSAKALCQFLINNHNASNVRFTTGRYKIYPDVILFLDHLVSENVLKVASKTFEDSHYTVINKQNTNNENSDDRDIQQMSLFDF